MTNADSDMNGKKAPVHSQISMYVAIALVVCPLMPACAQAVSPNLYQHAQNLSYGGLPRPQGLTPRPFGLKPRLYSLTPIFEPMACPGPSDHVQYATSGDRIPAKMPRPHSLPPRPKSLTPNLNSEIRAFELKASPNIHDHGANHRPNTQAISLRLTGIHMPAHSTYAIYVRIAHMSYPSMIWQQGHTPAPPNTKLLNNSASALPLGMGRAKPLHVNHMTSNAAATRPHHKPYLAQALPLGKIPRRHIHKHTYTPGEHPYHNHSARLHCSDTQLVQGSANGRTQQPHSAKHTEQARPALTAQRRTCSCTWALNPHTNNTNSLKHTRIPSYKLMLIQSKLPSPNTSHTYRKQCALQTERPQENTTGQRALFRHALFIIIAHINQWHWGTITTQTSRYLDLHSTHNPANTYLHKKAAPHRSTACTYVAHGNESHATGQKSPPSMYPCTHKQVTEAVCATMLLADLAGKKFTLYNGLQVNLGGLAQKLLGLPLHGLVPPELMSYDNTDRSRQINLPGQARA